MRTSSINFINW